MGNHLPVPDQRGRSKKLLIAVAVGLKASEYNCEKCAAKYCDADRRIPGSLGPAPFPKWAITHIGELRTCPKPMITGASDQWLRLHTHYRNNILPFSGGIFDQPAAFKRAMELIENNV